MQIKELAVVEYPNGTERLYARVAPDDEPCTPATWMVVRRVSSVAVEYEEMLKQSLKNVGRLDS